ncbi:DUF418 domain-containing protein [Myxococcus llanfairpwllgwyngyllgogerychwyrndrobwllllantysiliogogogochensis]|uniref:DUF418 domain-containing protein n=1 Tax=Myxococcus llanfairpwllgwyngyllgogerychwyrndrobwllllantysiliogogogochensis TaxID=2590453 RepID=A0A540WJZ2_9BACT|nr:DUF418 domain-containing protein [Myxococcus llanfairpwllgwyngyllgogerychwyrndrobwllllantysiliogogogochensis]TQF09335.1 DUF418 domain-containing protein [Myxococcus llanfairpwllgwyngyllgogerychwyrndrobwllllantysiliogogogochensis]
MTSAPSAVTTAEARPVDSGERLVLLDTLRGFALCGVFISNTFMWFSGRAFMPREQLESLFANGTMLDKVLLPVVTTLVSGRFITIFSFLFGLGFAVQMGRAEARGSPVTRLYVRRLGVMLLLGLTHLTLIWYGDILSNYALIGLWLLWFRRREDRTILKVAAVLLFAWPILSAVIFKLPQLMAATPEAAAALAKLETERSAALKADTLSVFQNGNWWAVVKGGLSFYRREFLLIMCVNSLALLGRFLLGFYAGRKRLFHDAPQHVAFFRRLFFWSLGLGVLGSSVGVVTQQLVLRKIINPETLPVWLPMVLAPVRALGEVGIAATYVSGITLLFQRATWQKILSVLAPVGRMALTNYLSQSVISILVFYGYGLGLVGKLTPSMSILYCLGVFTVQIAWSHLWLARFRFGPMEWVWRSLTYGKAQPMRRSTEAAGAAVAT